MANKGYYTRKGKIFSDGTLKGEEEGLLESMEKEVRIGEELLKLFLEKVITKEEFLVRKKKVERWKLELVNR